MKADSANLRRTADMLPYDPVALIFEAIDRLLTEDADSIEAHEFGECVEFIAECVLDTECDRSTANQERLDEWLSRVTLRLSSRHLRETEGN
jgi:hypothetical protein